MRPSTLLLAPALALLAAASGCVRGGRGALAATAFAVDVVDVAAIGAANPEKEWTTADERPVDPPGAPNALAPIPPHLPASAADQRVDKQTAFDLGGAYGALAKVDLAPCKALGIAPGYGRVVLAFDPDGTPAGVGVDLPAGSTPAAQTCVEQAFGAVRVAPFDGAPMNVRRAFFVKG
jgi:hypothetical protein